MERSLVRVALALLAPALAAVAEPDVVDEVLAAFRAGDAARLAALAAEEDPDPWLVADELLARGAPDAAEAFAGAAPRRAVAGLPGYVRARRAEPVDEAERALLARVNDLREKGEHAAVLAAVEGADRTAATVAGVRLRYSVGVALLRGGRPADALPELRAAAETAETIGWLRRAAWCRLQEGNCATENGTRAETWERALVLGEAAADRMIARILLQSLGVTYREMRQFDRALACQERAIRVAEEAGDRVGVGTSLEDIALIHKDRGEFRRALEHGRRALSAFEAAGDRAGVARTVGHIGCFLQHVGELRPALEHQERALRLSGELGDAQGIARAHLNLANAHEALGDYAKALAHHETAVGLMGELGDVRGAAVALGNIGNIYRTTGDLVRALAHYERALRDASGDPELRAATLGNLAAAHSQLGDLPKARERMTEALALREQLGNKMWIAIALDGLSVIHRALGEPGKARACGERALALSEAAGDRVGMATAHANLGRLHIELREFEEALARLETALRLFEEVGDPEGTARTHWALTALHAARADHRRAVACAREAVEIASRLGRGLPDEQQSSARERFGDLFGAGALAAAAIPDPEMVAFFLESGRAGALREALPLRDAILGFAVPAPLREAEVAAREAELAARAALREARGDLAATREARAALDAARERVRDAGDRIQREAKAAADVLGAPVDGLARIRERLGPGEDLVLYGVFHSEAIALVAGKEEARIVRLGKAADIADACAALRAGVPGADVADAVARLRALVLDPLGAEAPRLLVSPDGPLSYVPFALLAPDREIAHVPSATTYGILLDARGARGEGVLALGDPDYGGKPREGVAALRGDPALPRLAGTAAEAKAVGDLVLLGKDASEPALREALPRRARWRAVHLACHGIVDPERPTLSALALSPAGADDGFLTAIEVFRMRIPADLAVLSACETGRGKLYRGEGIVGLARAFMFAGAPRVVVSLWRVDDDATRALMARFYEGWNAGKPAAAALRDAQAFVRSQEKWRHPAYWAAWVLWGLPE